MADTAETQKKTAARAAEQAKAGAEAMHEAGTRAFREGVEKTFASFGDINEHGRKNLEAVVESASAARKGAEELSQQALGFGRKSWEDNVAAAQSLAKARSVQELVDLQTLWAKSATEAYMAQFTKSNEIFSASLKDCFKPINARVAATVESFQTAR